SSPGSTSSPSLLFTSTPLLFSSFSFFYFFFPVPSTPEIYTLSLHDALPISLDTPASPVLHPKSLAACAPARSLGCESAPESRAGDRKSTRLNSSHQIISYAVFCLKKKKKQKTKKTINESNTFNIRIATLRGV